MSWDVEIREERDACIECCQSSFIESKCCQKEVCSFCGTPKVRNTVWESNYTSNTAPMLQKAAVALGLITDKTYIRGFLHRKPAYECASILQACIAWMIDNKEEMIKLNPKNGWGSYTGYLSFLQEWRDKCYEHTSLIVLVE